ncbi:aspartyl-phosphate phosphatase Spo0E family protein [Lederbergia sp. NSJ-179]|uniref:aspartyl-phosphate phosphatase Spo0E family protein n=1 Tax=Lederbergia sp. NSJ-179 TaxID=2931402 RepID=UPI001FD53ECB|nr:aspartyl-phosphate phosphatase Spo0E family protein [Lederbergia sp. NSJ-179]MCJ7841720.1 aspartyl-phosphate phosphatase Spo0E family protein [Lederbergia sp. NSJ-179]
MYYGAKEPKKLLAQIQEKRKEMYLFGELYGLNAEKTIICSQELDSMMNQYYKMCQVVKNSNQSKIPRTSVANQFVKQQRLQPAK